MGWLRRPNPTADVGLHFGSTLLHGGVPIGSRSALALALPIMCKPLSVVAIEVVGIRFRGHLEGGALHLHFSLGLCLAAFTQCICASAELFMTAFHVSGLVPIFPALGFFEIRAQLFWSHGFPTFVHPLEHRGAIVQPHTFAQRPASWHAVPRRRKT